jgi:hypothetical protein
MSRIPAPLAARVDRLSRAAHAFHRFAHHPLCDEYGGEVVRLGRRTRVCRGCLFVGVGSCLGLSTSFFWPAPASAALFLLALALVGLAAAMFWRGSPRRRRSPKFVSRFLPAWVIAHAFGLAVQLGPIGGALAAAGAVPVFGVVALYRRRGPDRTPCATCAERSLATPCRGVAPIVRRERAFRRLAGQWMARVGP